MRGWPVAVAAVSARGFHDDCLNVELGLAPTLGLASRELFIREPVARAKLRSSLEGCTKHVV